MSAYSGSRHSSPVSVTSLASTSVEPSDRLLRSECRRQGGKHCGHVECQVRSAAMSRRSAAETAADHHHRHADAGETPSSSAMASATAAASPSPMTVWRLAGSGHQFAQKARRTTTTTTTTSTMISSRLQTLQSQFVSSGSSIATRRSRLAAANAAAGVVDVDDDDEDNDDDYTAVGGIGVAMAGSSSNNSNSSRGSAAAAARSGRCSAWLTKARHSDDEDDFEKAEEEAMEKGQLDASFSSKASRLVAAFDAGDDEAEVAPIAPRRFGAAFVMAIVATLRLLFYSAPRLALLWLAGAAVAALGGLRRGLGCAVRAVFSTVVIVLFGYVVMVTRGLFRSVKSMLNGTAAMSTKCVSYCWKSLSSGVAMVAHCFVYCTAALLRGIVSTAHGVSWGTKSSLASVAIAFLWLVSGVQSGFVQAASWPVYSVHKVVMATRRTSYCVASCCHSFAATSVAIVKRRRRFCLCLLPLLVLLLLLLLLLLGFYGLMTLPSNGTGSLRAVSESASRATVGIWSAGCLATHSALLWLRQTATKTAAAVTWSAGNSGDSGHHLPDSGAPPPAPPTTPVAAISAGCCRTDLSALEAEVAELRSTVAELTRQQQIPPAPISPPPVELAVDAASAAALAALSDELAELKLRLAAAETTASVASATATESARTVAASVQSASAASSEAERRRSVDKAASLAADDLRRTVGQLAANLAALAARLRHRCRADAASAAAAAIALSASSQNSKTPKTAADVAAAEAAIADLRLRIEQMEAAAAASIPLPPPPPACCQPQLQPWHLTTSAVTPIPADDLPDFALHSAGGHVVGTRCTKPYSRRHSYLHLLGLPVLGFSNGPNTALQPSTHMGECWPFEGFPGHLLVRLAVPARVTRVTLDHVPRRLTYNNSVASAPRNFSVYGLRSESDPFADARHLGSFAYDADAGPASQTFALAPSEVSEEVFPCVELVVHSNHGGEYTCIYRFRVHGSLA